MLFLEDVAMQKEQLLTHSREGAMRGYNLVNSSSCGPVHCSILSQPKPSSRSCSAKKKKKKKKKGHARFQTRGAEP